MGEDQDAAGARGLDEADGGDGLAGAGRVLEPEALAGVGVLGRLGDVLGLGLVGRLVPVLRLVLVLVLVVLVDGESPGVEHRRRRRGGRRRRSSGDRRAARSACPRARRPGGRRARCRRPASARPARAGGRARAAATTGGASAATGPSRRRRARRARSPARGGAECRARARSRRPPHRSGRAHGRTRTRGRSLRLREAWPVRPLAWSQPWTARKVAVSSGRRLTRRTLQGKLAGESSRRLSAFPSDMLPASRALLKQTRRQSPPICHPLVSCAGCLSSSPPLVLSSSWSSA